MIERLTLSQVFQSPADRVPGSVEDILGSEVGARDGSSRPGRQHERWSALLRYDRHKLTLKDVHNCQYVACMNPTAGSFTIDPRLQRHFCVFAVSFPGQEALTTIYSTILTQHLAFRSVSIATQRISSQLVAAALGTALLALYHAHLMAQSPIQVLSSSQFSGSCELTMVVMVMLMVIMLVVVMVMILMVVVVVVVVVVMVMVMILMVVMVVVVVMVIMVVTVVMVMTVVTMVVVVMMIMMVMVMVVIMMVMVMVVIMMVMVVVVMARILW
ncbi:hypothetical protein P7K49_011931 [Saguinus oedipus]|uniref:Uncharacterized protein n=1 Tax=Saguinus oedipus TaxID=9490 RepID=A0ABQ9VS33_SAGOE|nr:hypothetical protein P7K49_011931 [Saguinus oedipus]